MKIFKNFLLTASISCCIFNPAYADFLETEPDWALSFTTGYNQYQNTYQNEGHSAIGRLSLEKYLLDLDYMKLGLEFGVQNGNNMRLDIPKSMLDSLGGLPVGIEVKPSLDLLLDSKIPFDIESTLYFFIKGGVAYRRAQIDRITVNSMTKYSPELQVGLGYQVNDFLGLNLGYQRIFGGNPNFTVNEVAETGHINNIPTQQGVLLGISVLF